MNIDVAHEIDLLVESLPSISENKKYWFIRTQSGSLFEEFIQYGFVALEHDEITLSFLNEIRSLNASDRIERIKSRIKLKWEERKKIDTEEIITERNISLRASQINKFYFEVKQGDTVVIPSYNSEEVGFGVVEDSFISNRRGDVLDQYVLKKNVKWLKQIKKESVGPYLYKIFTAHQSINNIGAYADSVEKCIKDLYIINDDAHLIINVGAANISAFDLFGLGGDIVYLVDQIALKFNLDIKSSDLEVSININSPGKIDLKSKIKKTTLLAGLVLLICGGGFETANGTKIYTEGLPGVIRAISDFIKSNEDLKMRQAIFEQYKDSLKVQQPEDMILLLKQVSDNKDLPQ